jgi:hypothetical protein
MNPVATSDAAFRGGACPTPEYTIAYTGNYTTSADANYKLFRLVALCSIVMRQVAPPAHHQNEMRDAPCELF